MYPRRTVSAVLPMALEAAPAPRNKAILLKELPAHRAVGRYLFGQVTPDDVLARHKTELLPLVNDVRQTESEAESESDSESESESNLNPNLNLNLKPNLNPNRNLNLKLQL